MLNGEHASGSLQSALVVRGRLPQLASDENSRMNIDQSINLHLVSLGLIRGVVA